MSTDPGNSPAEASAFPADVAVQAPNGVSEEAIVAHVHGEPVLELPQDLYIPPDALEVILETFEGPLDLLLYLIKRQNLDILNIPIAQITQQYMEYIRLMETMRLELAAEYLVMAAMLAEIKSRMLLPRVESDVDDEDDPRAELIRRLQEYERFKEASEKLGEIPRMERDNFPVQVEAPVIERDMPLPDVSLRELLMAFKDVAMRNHAMQSHNISREALLRVLYMLYTGRRSTGDSRNVSRYPGIVQGIQHRYCAISTLCTYLPETPFVSNRTRQCR